MLVGTQKNSKKTPQIIKIHRKPRKPRKSQKIIENLENLEGGDIYIYIYIYLGAEIGLLQGFDGDRIVPVLGAGSGHPRSWPSPLMTTARIPRRPLHHGSQSPPQLPQLALPRAHGPPFVSRN